jgi:hypothetical protein
MSTSNGGGASSTLPSTHGLGHSFNEPIDLDCEPVATRPSLSGTFVQPIDIDCVNSTQDMAQRLPSFPSASKIGSLPSPCSTFRPEEHPGGIVPRRQYYHLLFQSELFEVLSDLGFTDSGKQNMVVELSNAELLDKCGTVLLGCYLSNDCPGHLQPVIDSLHQSAR